MKKASLVFIFSFCLLAILSSQDKNTLKLNLTASYGKVLAGYTSDSAETFGEEAYGDSTYFDTEVRDTTMYKGLSAGIEYFYSEKGSLYFNLGYQLKPFSATYKKNTYPNDVTFYSDYKFLQYSFGLNYYFKWLMIGADFNFNHLLDSSSSHIIVGNQKYASFFSTLSESTTGYSINIGPYFRVKNHKIKIYGRFEMDNSDVFPYEYYVGEVNLWEASINLSMSI
jgi:hypothetical protein